MEADSSLSEPLGKPNVGKGLNNRKGKNLYVPDNLYCIKIYRKEDWIKYTTVLRGIFIAMSL